MSVRHRCGKKRQMHAPWCIIPLSTSIHLPNSCSSSCIPCRNRAKYTPTFLKEYMKDADTCTVIIERVGQYAWRDSSHWRQMSFFNEKSLHNFTILYSLSIQCDCALPCCTTDSRLICSPNHSEIIFCLIRHTTHVLYRQEKWNSLTFPYTRPSDSEKKINIIQHE